MRRLGRWLLGSGEQHALQGRLRILAWGALVAPFVAWIVDGQVPERRLWIECYACALILLGIANYRPPADGKPRPWPWQRTPEHSVRIVEHHPPPGEDWRPYKTAECSCGWVVDDKSDLVTDFMASRHSTTGVPRVVRSEGEPCR